MTGAGDAAGDWAGLVDDAAIFPPGNAPLPYAMHAWRSRPADDAVHVGSFVLRDTDLPAAQDFDAPLAVVVTGGAGQISGPVGLCERLGLRLAGLEIALRDPDDLAGNARRVVAALDAAGVGDDVQVFVELPQEPPTPGWLSAADEVAAAGHRLKFRTGGLTADAFPSADTLARWIDAALDRETPFKCTAGLHRALTHVDRDGFSHHGFLNVLVATGSAFAGAGLDDVVDRLANDDAEDMVRAFQYEDLAGARRWFTSFGSCSVDEPLQDLRALGLVAA